MKIMNEWTAIASLLLKDDNKSVLMEYKNLLLQMTQLFFFHSSTSIRIY